MVLQKQLLFQVQWMLHVYRVHYSRVHLPLERSSLLLLADLPHLDVQRRSRCQVRLPLLPFHRNRNSKRLVHHLWNTLFKGGFDTTIQPYLLHSWCQQALVALVDCVIFLDVLPERFRILFLSSKCYTINAFKFMSLL